MFNRSRNISLPSAVSRGMPTWRQRAVWLWLVTWFVFSMAFVR